MKLWPALLASVELLCNLLAMSAIVPFMLNVAVAYEPEKVEMIFWEHQTWKKGGGRQRLVLWADGRSDVILKAPGNVSSMSSEIAAWERTTDNKWTCYRRANPYFKDEVKKKFDAALAAGIGELKTFPITYVDGSGTLVGVQVDGKVTETIIPMFPEPGEKDGHRTENHKRFLAIEKVFGDFVKDAKQRVVRPSAK